jgi:hypothetical protein
MFKEIVLLNFVYGRAAVVSRSENRSADHGVTKSRHCVRLQVVRLGYIGGDICDVVKAARQSLDARRWGATRAGRPLGSVNKLQAGPPCCELAGIRRRTGPWGKGCILCPIRRVRCGCCST